MARRGYSAEFRKVLDLLDGRRRRRSVGPLVLGPGGDVGVELVQGVGQ